MDGGLPGDEDSLDDDAFGGIPLLDALCQAKRRQSHFPDVGINSRQCRLYEFGEKRMIVVGGNADILGDSNAPACGKFVQLGCRMVLQSVRLP